MRARLALAMALCCAVFSPKALAQYSTTLTQTQYTLAANTDTIIALAKSARLSLCLFNAGSGFPAMYLAFDQAAVVGTGLFLGSGSPTGNGLCWSYNGSMVPRNAVHAISAAGTTVIVWEGF